MSLATLERAILAELRVVAGDKKLQQEDIMEWSTGPVKAEEGETLYYLPELAVHVAVKDAPSGVRQSRSKLSAHLASGYHNAPNNAQGSRTAMERFHKARHAAEGGKK